MLMIACGHVFNNQKNLACYIEYLKGLYPGGPELVIEQARKEVGELLSSGRITLIYRNAAADEIADMVQAFADRGNIGAVFVDYIQKVPATPQGNGRFTAAYQKIQAASEALRDAAVRADVPLIMGAQFRRTDSTDKKAVLRLDNLRESGDIEQDANIVLGIYNKTAADLEESLNTSWVESITPDQVDINVAILKIGAEQQERNIFLSAASLKSKIVITLEQIEGGAKMPVKIAGIKMYTAKEISEILGVHVVTARKYMAEGRIKAKKIGGNRYLVTEAHLREFLETPDNIPPIEAAKKGEDDNDKS